MKKARSKNKILSVIMTVLILLVSLPTYAFATLIDNTTEAYASEEVSADTALASGNEASKAELLVLEEDISLREENVKHFKLSDGTYKAVAYASPVHYKDADGSWIDIDNSLTLNGSEYTANNKSEIKFANKSGSTGLISIKDGEYKIDFTPLNTNKVSVEIINPEENNSRKFDDIKKLNNLISKAKYANIYDGIDLEYILIGNNIKENIIVNEKQDTYSYSFEIKLNKLRAELVENSIILSDYDTGEQKYEIPAPYMLDNSGEYSSDVEYTLTQNNKWKYTLTVTASADWINAENRAFPVTIDPTIGVEMSVLTDATEYSNNITSTGSLKVGGGYKTQISFSSIPTLPKDAYLTDATISLNHISGSGTYVGVYQYNTDDICDYNEITNSGWYTWNIYDIVYGWYNNSKTRGLELKAVEGTSEIQFDSKETNASNRPIIEISYKDMKGLESYWSCLTQSVGIAGNGAVNLATGNLTFEIPTLTTTDSLFGYTPSMIYNSAIAGEAYKYGNAQIGYWGSYAANGFKVSFNEALIKDYYINSQGESEIYYIWADADGTEHYFFNNGEENVYCDEDGLQLILTVNDSDITENCIITDSGYNQRVFAHMSGTVSTEIEATWYLSQIRDKNGNAIYFPIDGSKRPNDVKIIPNGGSAITMISPLYNSDSAITLFWSNTTRKGILFRHSDTPTGNICTDGGGKYLKEALYLTCDNDISWYYLVNTFINDTDNVDDGITVDAIMRYEYDEDGYLTSVHNTLLDYKVEYTYSNGKVISITEYGADSTQGQTVSISYYSGYTEVQTSGLDDKFGNDDDLINVYTFDKQGRTVSTYTTNLTRTEIYGAVSGEYVTDNENAKNSIKATTTTGNVSPNYLLNGNFELSDDSAVYWSTQGGVAFPEKTVSQSSYEWDDVRLALSVVADGATSISQIVNLYPGDYTFSLDLLTYASENLTIKLIATAQDVENEEYTEQIAVNEAFASGSNNFGLLSFTVTGTKGVTRPYKISVSVDGADDAVGESIFVDNLMLVKASGAQGYSWLSNGSFDQSYETLENNVGTWQTNDNSSFIVHNEEFNNSLKMNGSISDECSVPQTIYQVSAQTLGNFISTQGSIGRSGETTFIISGFGKATEAMRNSKSKFSIIADIYCYEINEDNCQILRKELAFNSEAEGWQYVSGMITVPAGKFISKIELSCVYSNNIGEAYFDNIKFEICDYETPQVVQYDYFENGKIMSEKAGYNMTYYGYNEDGLINDVITKNTRVKYEYDENHNIITEKLYEFDENISYKSQYETIAAKVDGYAELMVTTAYKYNQYGQTIETIVTNAKDQTTLTATSDYYTNSGSKIFGALKTVTNSLGDVTEYFYDETNGRLISEISDDGTGYYYTYDVVGNLVLVQPATYSSSPSAVTDSSEIEYVYNDSYQLESIVANGTEYTIEYDVFGNQSSVWIGNTEIVSREYNNYNGKLSKVIYINGTTVSYEYDSLERLSKITFANGENSYSYSYTYDSNGNVTKFVDGKNNKAILYSYDLKGRLVKSVAYDTQNMINESGTQYNYDADNMLSNVWYTSDYTYDLTSSDVLRYNYGYVYTNENDALSAMQIRLASQSTLDISYLYDAWDRLTTKSIAFDVTNKVSYTYKETSTLVSEYNSSVVNGDNVISSKAYKYSYDEKNQNITEIRDANDNLLQKYMYDSLDRLIREDNAQTGKTYVFTYDNNGNILSEKIYTYTTGDISGLSPDTTNVYGYDNSSWADQLTSYNGETIWYDAMGNPLTYWDGTTFIWDAEGNLVSLNKGNLSISYKYNSTGIRAEKTVNGVAHYYTLDGTKILYEEYANVLLVYLYDEAGAPIGMAYREASYAQGVFDIYFFTKNVQGDIMEIYTNDGIIVASYIYDAWGNHTVTNYTNDNIGDINPFRYRGYYFDSETGFYYLNTRYYDPQIKRFISADSIEYLGANGDLNSFNLYAYCSNNPVMFVDPKGKSILSWFEETIGFGIVSAEEYNHINDYLFFGYGEGVSISHVLEGDISKPVSFYLVSASEWWRPWEYKVGIQVNINDGGFAYEYNPLEQNLTVSMDDNSYDFTVGIDKIAITGNNGVDFDEGVAEGYFHMFLRPIPTAFAAVATVGAVSGIIKIGVVALVAACA